MTTLNQQSPATPKTLTLSRYSEAMEIPLIIASLLFIVAYTWSVVAPPQGTMYFATEAVMLGTWAVFLVDFIITLKLTEKSKRWTLMNIIHLAVVILPVFRTLRLLRVVTLLRVLNRTTALAFRGRIMTYIVSSASLLTYLGAVSVLDAESGNENANITSFGDSLWWAFITITTVGYGDRYPVTLEGRLIAVGLTVAGVSLLGLVTVTMGTWVMEQIKKIREEEIADEEDDELKQELASTARTREELEAELALVIYRESEIMEALEKREA